MSPISDKAMPKGNAMQAPADQIEIAKIDLLPGTQTGVALIALAVAFNLPFARLAAVFDYPDVLRQDPAVILAAFSAGGPGLVLTWYAFAIAALLLLPVGMAHAFAAGRIGRMPALAVSAGVAGALAGLLQAMGLIRWVMVVPGLAASGDVEGFALIHAYAGVGIGEHLGQLMTALHVGLIGWMQRAEGRRWLAGLAGMTTASILIGSQEGVMIALGQPGDMFGLVTIAGYLLLTFWMILSGIVLIRK
jgi:hypothetical protein